MSNQKNDKSASKDESTVTEESSVFGRVRDSDTEPISPEDLPDEPDKE